MSKKLNWLDGKIVIDSMDKSTSEIKGVLTLMNKTSKDRRLGECVLDTYVLSDGVRPLLLHSYTLEVNQSISSMSKIDLDLSIDGLVLSSLASEVIDLEIRLRGTDCKTVLSVTRTEYIDYIEDVFKKFGFELSGYAVDVKNKMMTKLFRQYYIYTCDSIDGVEKIKVTYTPYDKYIRMCVYHKDTKYRTNLDFTDIKSTSVIEGKIRDIFREHKIQYCENFC